MLPRPAAGRLLGPFFRSAMGRLVRSSFGFSAFLVVARSLGLSACKGAGSAVASSVRDSAGIQLISHPASVLAAVPEWTIDTGVHQWTIGGGEDPATEISGIYCARRLADGRILLCHARPN